jgi:putative addiction module component (TIGR02574 family)
MSEVDHLLNEAMKLTEAQRAELAHRLLETVSDEDVHAIEPEIDAAWREEARRRSAQLRSGEVTGIPWEEVRRQILGK